MMCRAVAVSTPLKWLIQLNSSIPRHAELLRPSRQESDSPIKWRILLIMG